MTTGAAIVGGALGKLGLQGAATDTDGNDLAYCLAALNDACDSLGLVPTMTATETETTFALAAVSSVTLGPGQAIDIARPQRIEPTSFTRQGGVDHPLEPVDRDTYNEIAQKGVAGAWPLVCFWDGGNPTGRLYLYPPAACELHLFTRPAVAFFADAVAEYTLPAGLKEVLVYVLAERVAPDFQVPLPDSVARTGANLLRAWKRSNVRVPQLDTTPRRRDVRAEFLSG